MKDVYVQSGGVGLVHDLEGELSSVYGGVGLVHDLAEDEIVGWHHQLNGHEFE